VSHIILIVKDNDHSRKAELRPLTARTYYCHQERNLLQQLGEGLVDAKAQRAFAPPQSRKAALVVANTVAPRRVNSRDLRVHAGQ
jgi:hypothetical protein